LCYYVDGGKQRCKDQGQKFHNKILGLQK